jgi:Ca2+:H+ antiporter
MSKTEQTEAEPGGHGTSPLFTWLLILVPIALVLELMHAAPLVIFAVAALAIVPLAEWMRRGTEHVAHHAGSAIGGLLNVSFGNAAELILAIFVLMDGNIGVVKATITGSIIGNSLLGLGLAILVGSWGRQKMTFQANRAGLLGSLLILAVIALLLPALYDYTERTMAPTADIASLDQHLSLGVAIVLIAVYIGNLIYTLRTHKSEFAIEEPEASGHAVWPLKKALGVLLAATLAVALMAEFVSGALEEAATTLGLSEFFLGLIVLPIIGNAAEYFSAIYYGRRNQMDMVMTIAVGATIQVAMMTAPLLVILSYVIGHPMNLVFGNVLELAAIIGSAFAVNSIAQDGETTWFEGMMLLAVYTLLAISFFFVRV